MKILLIKFGDFPDETKRLGIWEVDNVDSLVKHLLRYDQIEKDDWPDYISDYNILAKEMWQRLISHGAYDGSVSETEIVYARI